MVTTRITDAIKRVGRDLLKERQSVGSRTQRSAFCPFGLVVGRYLDPYFRAVQSAALKMLYSLDCLRLLT